MTGDPTDETPRFAAGELEAFAAGVLEAVGLPAPDAATVADLMVRSDLLGASGHGIFRLPQYVRRIRAGGINARPRIRTERDAGATALVDGDNAMGHLVLAHAARIAVEKAAAHGIGWVGVHHGNHAGAASVYARMPLEHGQIGLYSAVGSANHLPPWGGIDMLLSTNPIAVAIPAHAEPPIVLDMATTVAAYGKVKTAAQQGRAIPQGWMIDREGRPLTDPTRADDGFLLPIGGYKGYGLALVLGLLAGTLNGAAMGRDVVDFNADDVTVTNTGQFICAIAPEAFGDPDAFARAVDEVARAMRSSARLPGVESIRVPGDGAHAKREAYEADGVPIHRALLETLAVLAQDIGAQPLR